MSGPQVDVENRTATRDSPQTADRLAACREPSRCFVCQTGINVRVYTSIPPKFSRKDTAGKEIGPKYLMACVTSWRENGFTPVSINRPDEVDAVNALNLPLEVFPASMREAMWPDRYGPPLGDLFDLLPETRIAYVNADIFLLQADLARALRGFDDAILIAARRADVVSLGADTFSPFALGSDLFSFNPASIPGVIRNPHIRRFQLGAPWWDYVFPLACKTSVALTAIEEPLIAHQLHDDRWSEDVWNHLAVEAARAVADLYPDPFQVILDHAAEYPNLEPTVAMAFQWQLFEDLSMLPLQTRPCRTFDKIPESVGIPTQVTPPFIIRPAPQQPVEEPKPKEPKSKEPKSTAQQIVHGLRDTIRHVRRKRTPNHL
jgi:hypothetical protein